MSLCIVVLGKKISRYDSNINHSTSNLIMKRRCTIMMQISRRFVVDRGNRWDLNTAIKPIMQDNIHRDH